MPLIIAGGLPRKMSRQAMRAVSIRGAWMLSPGWSAGPGKKMKRRLHEFVAAVRHTQAIGKTKGVMEETDINIESSPAGATPPRSASISAFAPLPGRFGALRRALRSRNADGSVAGAGSAYDEARKDQSFRDELARLLHRLRRAADSALPRPSGSPPTGWREDLPEARRPAAHRRAQNQQLPGAGAAGASAWARTASSRKPARASTAWRRPPCARCSAWNASSTWARKTCGGRSPTSSA